MGIPVEKNKAYELQIDAMGSTGEGIGRLDGFTVFVDGALSGETVRILMLKVKKKLWLWEIAGNFNAITGTMRTALPCGKTVRRLPVAKSVLSGAACL